MMSITQVQKELKLLKEGKRTNDTDEAIDEAIGIIDRYGIDHFERMMLNIEQRIVIAETNKQIVTQKCLPRDFWIGYTEALTELLHDTEPVRLKITEGSEEG